MPQNKVNNAFGNGVRTISVVAEHMPAHAKIRADHMPNGMPKNEKLALEHMPNGMPKNEKLAPPKSAVRLECIRADEQSPFLILKRNKELLISMSSRVGVLAPKSASAKNWRAGAKCTTKCTYAGANARAKKCKNCTSKKCHDARVRKA